MLDRARRDHGTRAGRDDQCAPAAIASTGDISDLERGGEPRWHQFRALRPPAVLLETADDPRTRVASSVFAAFFTRPEIGFKPRSRDDEHAIAMKPRKHKKLSTFYEDEDGDGDGAVGGRGGRDSAGGASQRAAKAAKRESFERGKAPARDPVELVDDEDEDAPDENDVNAVTMVRDRTPATRNPRRGARTVADPARPVAAARVPSFRDRAPDRLRLVTDPDRPPPLTPTPRSRRRNSTSPSWTPTTRRRWCRSSPWRCVAPRASPPPPPPPTSYPRRAPPPPPPNWAPRPPPPAEGRRTRDLA